MKTIIQIFLALLVAAASFYFWFVLFDSNPCPDGTRLVETVWTDTTTGAQSVSNVCVQGEE